MFSRTNRPAASARAVDTAVAADKPFAPSGSHRVAASLPRLPFANMTITPPSGGHPGVVQRSSDDADMDLSERKESNKYDEEKMRELYRNAPKAGGPTRKKLPDVSDSDHKLYLRDSLRRAIGRHRERSGRGEIRYRSDETSRMDMEGRTKKLGNPAVQLPTPFGSAEMGQSPYEPSAGQPRQPVVRVSMADHRGFGGRNTPSDYTKLNALLTNTGKTPQVLGEVDGFLRSTGAPQPSNAQLAPKEKAAASMLAGILIAESHNSRVDDGGKMQRAGLAQARSKGSLAPTFTSEKGKAGIVTSEDEGQASFWAMMDNPVANMADRNVGALEWMSESSDDEAQAKGRARGPASAPMSRSGAKPPVTRAIRKVKAAEEKKRRRSPSASSASEKEGEFEARASKPITAAPPPRKSAPPKKKQKPRSGKKGK